MRSPLARTFSSTGNGKAAAAPDDEPAACAAASNGSPASAAAAAPNTMTLMPSLFFGRRRRLGRCRRRSCRRTAGHLEQLLVVVARVRRQLVGVEILVAAVASELAALLLGFLDHRLHDL